MAIDKLKDQKSQGKNQIPSGFVKAEGRKIRPDICKLIYSVWNKEKFPEVWKQYHCTYL
jgi:mannosyltransferase OCH1-like enzyme